MRLSQRALIDRLPAADGKRFERALSRRPEGVNVVMTEIALDQLERATSARRAAKRLLNAQELAAVEGAIATLKRAGFAGTVLASRAGWWVAFTDAMHVLSQGGRVACWVRGRLMRIALGRID